MRNGGSNGADFGDYEDEDEDEDEDEGQGETGGRDRREEGWSDDVTCVFGFLNPCAQEAERGYYYLEKKEESSGKGKTAEIIIRIIII